jgi:hypothetical protein
MTAVTNGQPTPNPAQEKTLTGAHRVDENGRNTSPLELTTSPHGAPRTAHGGNDFYAKPNSTPPPSPSHHQQSKHGNATDGTLGMRHLKRERTPKDDPFASNAKNKTAG